MEASSTWCSLVGVSSLISARIVHCVNVSGRCVSVHVVCCHRRKLLGVLQGSLRVTEAGAFVRPLLRAYGFLKAWATASQVHHDVGNHLCSDGAVEAGFSGESQVSPHTVAGCPVKVVGPAPQDMCLFTCEPREIVAPFPWTTGKAR